MRYSHVVPSDIDVTWATLCNFSSTEALASVRLDNPGVQIPSFALLLTFGLGPLWAAMEKNDALLMCMFYHQSMSKLAAEDMLGKAGLARKASLIIRGPLGRWSGYQGWLLGCSVARVHPCQKAAWHTV